MEEKDIISQEEHKSDKKGFFSKLGKGIVAGAKFVGKKLEEGVDKIKENIEESKAEKALENSIVQQFNSSALKFTMVVPAEKTKFIKLFGQINYSEKTLTFYGDIANLTTNVYFIDEANQKFEISLIRLKQSMDITVNNTVYPRNVSVVEYKLSADDETKKQMQTIINNNQINIVDSGSINENIEELIGKYC